MSRSAFHFRGGLSNGQSTSPPPPIHEPLGTARCHPPHRNRRNHNAYGFGCDVDSFGSCYVTAPPTRVRSSVTHTGACRVSFSWVDSHVEHSESPGGRWRDGSYNSDLRRAPTENPAYRLPSQFPACVSRTGLSPRRFGSGRHSLDPERRFARHSSRVGTLPQPAMPLPSLQPTPWPD